ncbi:MAG: outer membrane protein assembly factor BamD [Vicingaceae bacterium]
MRKLLAFISVAVVFASCSKYQRILKSSDVELKYAAAMKYYDEEDYNRAYPILEEIAPLFRGTERSEEINFRYAKCNYYLRDYILAGYHFQRFYSVFPLSDLAEEAMFLSAFCFYMNSPVYSLDQSNSYESIGEFKKFLNTYPASPLIDSAQNMVTEMNLKLEHKAFEIARLQFTTENYKASIVAFNNFLRDYPGTSYEKEANFLVLRSSYLLAMNSVQSKKEDRINDTIDAYYNFVDNFDDEKYLKESEIMYDSILKERQNLITGK